MLETAFGLFEIRLRPKGLVNIGPRSSPLGAETLRLRHQTPSFASREKLDCDYVKIISVVMIIRYGYTPLDNYEL